MPFMLLKRCRRNPIIKRDNINLFFFKNDNKREPIRTKRKPSIRLSIKRI
jgi:hypothetical protein